MSVVPRVEEVLIEQSRVVDNEHGDDIHQPEVPRERKKGRIP